jgi:hypothetical protein
MPVEPLKPEELYECCDPKMFDYFKTTADIKPTDGTIGQDRAMKALDWTLALRLRAKGLTSSCSARAAPER